MNIFDEQCLPPQLQETKIYARPVCHQSTSVLQLPQQEQQTLYPKKNKNKKQGKGT